MGVTIRTRPLSGGREALYLDIVHRKNRKTVTTEYWLYLNEGSDKKKEKEKEKHNQRHLNLTNNRKTEIEEQIRENTFQFVDTGKAITDFISFFKIEADERYKVRGAKSNTNCCFKHLCKFTENKCKFSDLDKAFVLEFQRYLIKAVPKTADTYYKRFKRQLAKAVREGYLKFNPAEDVKNIRREEANRVTLTESEVKALKATTHGHPLIKRMFLFSIYTGLRISDLKAIKWENVIEDKLHFYPVKNKRLKMQVVKLNENAKMYMGERGKSSDYIFNWPWSRFDHKYTKLRDWTYQAGITRPVTWHTGRHTFATLLLKKTNNIVIVKDALLHSKIETTMVYAKIMNMELCEALDSLDDI